MRRKGRRRSRTHDGSLQLGDDAENLRVLCRTLRSISSSLKVRADDGVADRHSKDRSDKGESE